MSHPTMGHGFCSVEYFQSVAMLAIMLFFRNLLPPLTQWVLLCRIFPVSGHFCLTSFFGYNFCNSLILRHFVSVYIEKDSGRSHNVYIIEKFENFSQGRGVHVVEHGHQLVDRIFNSMLADFVVVFICFEAELSSKCTIVPPKLTTEICSC